MTAFAPRRVTVFAPRRVTGPRWLRWLFTVVVTFVLVFFARTSRADDRPEYDVHFRVDSSAEPAAVCVFMLADDGKAPNRETFLSWAEVEKLGRASEDKRPEYRSIVSALSGLEAWSEGLERSKGPNSAPMCTGAYEVPQSPVSDGERRRKFLCRSFAGNAPPQRVVILDARFENREGRVERVRLLGSTLRIEVSGTKDPLLVRAVGGWYAPLMVAQRTTPDVTLDLTPKCTTRTVRTTGTSASCVAYDVEAPGPDGTVRRFVGRGPLRQGQFDVVVPQHAASTVSVTARPFEPFANTTCEAPENSERGRTDAPGPLLLTRTARAADKEIQLGAQEIRFSWTRDCGHPTGACPNVTLPGVLASCKPTTGAVCSYSCELAERPTLPVDVRFDWGEAGSWVERLVSADQSLGGGTPDLAVRISLDKWDSVPRLREWMSNGDGIDHIEITSPSGETYRITPDQRPAPLLHVPRAACGAKWQYRIVGDRRYRDGLVALSGAEVSIDDPRWKASHIEIDAAAGGGWVGTGGGFAKGAKPYGTVSAILQFYPWRMRLYFDWRLTGMLSSHLYTPYSTARDPANESELFARFFWEGNVFFRVNRWLDAGGGIGQGAGYSYFDSANERIGEPRFYWLTASVLSRLRFSRAVSLELGIRGFPEDRYRFTPPFDDPLHAQRGNPIRSMRSFVALAAGGSLMIRL